MLKTNRKVLINLFLYTNFLAFLQLGCVPDKKKRVEYAQEPTPEPTNYVDAEKARVVMTYKRLASKSYPGEAYIQIHLNEPANVTCTNCDASLPITFVDASKGVDYHYYGSITYPLQKGKTTVCSIDLNIERLLSKRVEKITYELYFCPVSEDKQTLNCDQASAERKCPFER